jgi:hypothetical protein
MKLAYLSLSVGRIKSLEIKVKVLCPLGTQSLNPKAVAGGMVAFADFSISYEPVRTGCIEFQIWMANHGVTLRKRRVT